MHIALAETDPAIARCFPVMAQLRPQLRADAFVARIRAQAAERFQLAYVEDGGAICSVAGFRLMRKLHSGDTLYVDDLVTDSARRSQRYGDALFDWLVAYARQHGCQSFQLDSGTHRVDAHRFYLRKRMRISAFHFDLPL